MKKIFFIAFLITSNISWGQINFKINIPHLAFGSTTTKSIRMAGEVQFTDRYSTQVEYGISWHQIAPGLNDRIATMSSDIWHFEFRRYFISGIGDEKGQYFAIDYFQKDQMYDRLWDTGQNNGGTHISELQWLNVKRNEKAISIIFGYQSNQDERQDTRIFLDAYFGLGIRSRKVINDLQSGWGLINHNQGDLLDVEQNRIMLNVIIGFKVGLKLIEFDRS